MRHEIVKRGFVLVLVATFGASVAAAAPISPLKVLVTNDDGVGAPGIDALVEELRLNPDLEITVIAPAANASGTGENRTAPPATIQVTDATTASGYPAKAVTTSLLSNTTGYPGDTVLWGVLQEMQADPPDLVLSGINSGQNLSADIIPISGTVGAATWGARLGIPAFAVSAGIPGTPNYAQAAQFTANLVEKFRKSGGFQKKMKEKDPSGDSFFRGLVLNINVPTCPTGSVRGARVVAVGRLSNFTGYTLLSGTAVTEVWEAVAVNGNAFTTNCESTVDSVYTDLEAFNNGFATVTPLNAERNVVGRRIKQFRFAEKLF